MVYPHKKATSALLSIGANQEQESTSPIARSRRPTRRSRATTRSSPKEHQAVLQRNNAMDEELVLMGPFVVKFLMTQGITKADDFLTRPIASLASPFIGFVKRHKDKDWKLKTASNWITRWRRDLKQRRETVMQPDAANTSLHVAFQVFDQNTLAFFQSQQIASPQEFRNKSRPELVQAWIAWHGNNDVSTSGASRQVTDWRESIQIQLTEEQLAEALTAPSGSLQRSESDDTTNRATANVAPSNEPESLVTTSHGCNRDNDNSEQQAQAAPIWRTRRRKVARRSIPGQPPILAASSQYFANASALTLGIESALWVECSSSRNGGSTVGDGGRPVRKRVRRVSESPSGTKGPVDSNRRRTEQKTVAPPVPVENLEGSVAPGPPIPLEYLEL